MIANFFHKAALGASQVLKNFDKENFEKVLHTHSIQILFDDNAVRTVEGRATLDLLVRLLSRLYPIIAFSGPEDFRRKLEKLARSINPDLQTDVTAPSILIAVGKTKYETSVPIFYIGSDEWVCKFSKDEPVASSDSSNPFGAGAAACIGAANIFRTVFTEQLPYSESDQAFSLSLLDFSLNEHSENQKFDGLNLGEFHLVGLGAIGNSFIWALASSASVCGHLHIIDKETVSLTNLQRYVLSDQTSIDRYKTDIISDVLQTTALEFSAHATDWETFINQKGDYCIETAVTCLDSADTRIAVQSALPKEIFNAWTQTENLGVSSHSNFGNEPCICCLYMPSLKRKNRSNEIADNLNMADQEPLIRRMLANNYPVDDALIKLIAHANGLNSNEEMQRFVGRSIDVFYSDVICGGLLMKMTDNSQNNGSDNMHVPSAFESAMAGILLAAELIKNKMGYTRTRNFSTVQLNLIRSIGPYLHHPALRNPDCICSDPIYSDTYREKWT